MSAAIQHSETAQGAPIYQGPKAEAIAAAIENVRYAISRDETRYNLCIVQLEGRWAYATDGHRLAACRIAGEDELPLEAPLQAVAVGSVKGKRDVRSLITGAARVDYPNVRQVIPKAARVVGPEIPCEPLAEFLAMRIACGEKAERCPIVTIEADDAGLWCRWTVKRDLGAEAVGCLRLGDTVPEFAFRAAFNAHYLADAVAQCGFDSRTRGLDGEFALSVSPDSPADKPAMLAAVGGFADRFAVVMPCRLGE